MSKALIPSCSSVVHVEFMARTVTEGARFISASGDPERADEMATAEIAKPAYLKLDQVAPVIAVAGLGLCASASFSAPRHFLPRLITETANKLSHK